MTAYFHINGLDCTVCPQRTVRSLSDYIDNLSRVRVCATTGTRAGPYYLILMSCVSCISHISV